MYQLDFPVFVGTSQSFLDFSEMLYLRMLLHEATNLLLPTGGDKGTQTYLAFLHVWGEMTDDGALGKISLGGYLVDAQSLLKEVITNLLGWNLRSLRFLGIRPPRRTATIPIALG